MRYTLIYYKNNNSNNDMKTIQSNDWEELYKFIKETNKTFEYYYWIIDGFVLTVNLIKNKSGEKMEKFLRKNKEIIVSNYY
jgi:hypothetical protein